jgi:penicillin-binding protein 2
MAGLRHDLIAADTHFPVGCAGGYFYGGRRFGCWLKTGHGNLNTIGALQHSCDVYFYQLGLRMGLDRLARTARDLGLGERTGIDLPAETRGLVPDKAWYDKRFTRGWPRGIMLNLAIGQGEWLTSPLQLATMTAVIANSGRPVRPHVVQAVAGVPGFRVEKPVEPGIETGSEHWQTIHDAMLKVVEAGTGGASRLPGVKVAGKTGTAQNPHGNDHALFVAYAPYDDPQYALAVVAENSGHGGSVAAPIAGHVFRRVLLRDSTVVQPTRPMRRDTTRTDSSGVSGD